MTAKTATPTGSHISRRSTAKAIVSAEPITKGERTRSTIIDTAYQLFLQNGFHGTSMRDIARGAGIALGGIYNHFGTKEDIFLAMLTERHSFMKIAPALQAARGDTVEDLVCDAAVRMIEALGQSRNLIGMMFIEQVEFNGKHIPQLIKQFYPGLKEFVERLTQMEGKLRPIPKPVLLRVFIGLFFSYYMTERLLVERQPAKHPHHSDFDYFVEIYLHGVLAKG